MESREAETSDGKGKSSSMQHGQNFNLQRAFRQIPGGGEWKCSASRGSLHRGGRMQPQRTTWNTCVLTVQLPPLHKCQHEYSSWRWSEVKLDHLGVGYQNACRFKVHLSANRRQENIQDQVTYWPKDVQHCIWHILHHNNNVTNYSHPLLIFCHSLFNVYKI